MGGITPDILIDGKKISTNKLPSGGTKTIFDIGNGYVIARREKRGQVPTCGKWRLRRDFNLSYVGTWPGFFGDRFEYTWNYLTSNYGGISPKNYLIADLDNGAT